MNSTQKIMRQYLSEVSAGVKKLPLEKIEEVVELFKQARLKGNRVFIFGMSKKVNLT